MDKASRTRQHPNPSCFVHCYCRRSSAQAGQGREKGNWNPLTGGLPLFLSLVCSLTSSRETRGTGSGAFGERGSRSCYRFQLGWRQAHPGLPSTVRCHLGGSQPWSPPPETRLQLLSNSYPSQTLVSCHSQTVLFPHCLRLHPASDTFEVTQVFTGALWGSIPLLGLWPNIAPGHWWGA